MAFSEKSCAFLLVVLATVCIQLYRAHDFPGRCSCPIAIAITKHNVTDFQVLGKRPGCDKTELIVTIYKSSNSTEKICLNTEKKMAKAFLRCWDRINKDKSRKVECIDRSRKSV